MGIHCKDGVSSKHATPRSNPTSVAGCGRKACSSGSVSRKGASKARQICGHALLRLQGCLCRPVEKRSKQSENEQKQSVREQRRRQRRVPACGQNWSDYGTADGYDAIGVLIIVA